MNRRMALSNVILMVASLAVGGATPVAAFAPPNPHCTASSSATVPSPTSSIIFLPWEPSSSATKTLSRKQARLLPLTRLQGNILHPAVSDAVKSSSSSSAGVGGIVFHHHNAHHVALAGSLWPVLQKLRLTPAKISAIWTNVAHITDWKGLAFLSTLAFGITPTAKYLYYRINKRKLQLLREELLENGDLEMAGELDDADDSRFFSTFESDGFHSALESGGKNTGLRSMAQMKRFGAVAFIDQISKVSLSVYAMDVISIMLTTVGFTFPKKCRISDNYAKIACT